MDTEFVTPGEFILTLQDENQELKAQIDGMRRHIEVLQARCKEAEAIYRQRGYVPMAEADTNGAGE